MCVCVCVCARACVRACVCVCAETDAVQYPRDGGEVLRERDEQQGRGG